MEKLFLNVEEIAEACGCSKQKAYLIIREANEELKAKGYLTQMENYPKNTSWKWFMEKMHEKSKHKRKLIYNSYRMDEE